MILKPVFQPTRTCHPLFHSTGTFLSPGHDPSRLVSSRCLKSEEGFVFAAAVHFSDCMLSKTRIWGDSKLAYWRLHERGTVSAILGSS